jgi:hypothetical protein
LSRTIAMRDGSIVSDTAVKDRRRASEDLADWKKRHALLAGEEAAS